MLTTSEIIGYFIKYIAPISIAAANFFKFIYKIRFGFLHLSKSKTERIFALFSQDPCKNTANRYALYIAVGDALSSFYPIPEIEFAFARSNPLVMLRDMRAVRHLVRLNVEKNIIESPRKKSAKYFYVQSNLSYGVSAFSYFPVMAFAIFIQHKSQAIGAFLVISYLVLAILGFWRGLQMNRAYQLMQSEKFYPRLS
ncbi:hypothetical protein HKD27_12770 [Gluconobacter sp. R75690]|uniref:hypothetical protein n=1 Tax=unclassified Gluconobacter TaxID=2644261 RepID=UPI00188D4D63|nr:MULTISPECIES: hypothetical protein [unclassified Gluconobacter]MBF0851772.1 hypothetical protein [Gluconobacter sp. R75690]MBF0880485.1 hypothetical protein [Gluconobacter sp. R75828]